MSSNYRPIVPLGGYKRLVAFSAWFASHPQGHNQKLPPGRPHIAAECILISLGSPRCTSQAPRSAPAPAARSPRQLITFDRSAVAFAPNWHLTLSMSRNYRAAIDDFGDFRERKFTAIGLGDPGQVGRRDVEGACEPPIALTHLCRGKACKRFHIRQFPDADRRLSPRGCFQ
jgi:hypothetical protein